MIDNKMTAYLDKLPTAEIANDNKVQDKFVQLFNVIHGTAMGEAFCKKEQFNFGKLLAENQELQSCTKLSLYGAFLDIAVNGLSLDNTSKPLCYLMSRGAKARDSQGREIWEKRAYIKVSPSGEIYYRKRAGQVKEADDPQIVWEGDVIKVGLNKKGKHVVKEHERLIPRKKDAKILGGYIRIERFDGSYECSWMDIVDVDRLRAYSNKQNKGTSQDDKSNRLYTSFHGQIDPGFFEAKITRHAFDSYPNVKIGANTILASSEDLEIKRPLKNKEEVQNAEDVTEKNETGAFGGDQQEDKGKGIEVTDESGAF